MWFESQRLQCPSAHGGRLVVVFFFFFFENLVKMMKRERAAGPLLQTMCVRVLTMLHRVTHQFKSNDWQSARNKSSRWCSVCLSSPVPPADLPCDNAWVTCVCVCVCGSGVTCPPRDNHLKKHHGFTVLHIFSPPPGWRGLQLCPGLVGWSVSRTGQGPGWRMGLGPEQIPLRGDRSRNFCAPPFFYFFIFFFFNKLCFPTFVFISQGIMDLDKSWVSSGWWPVDLWGLNYAKGLD